MKPGVYAGISNHDYHNGPGISNSGLTLVRKSPMHYRVKKLAANDNVPSVSTPAQMIGTAFHALLLEPAEFTKDYCLGLRQSDAPNAIDIRDQLVAMAEAINVEREAILASAVQGSDQLKAMISKLNETRLPKLQTSGASAEIAARIIAAQGEMSLERDTMETLGAMKGAELKTRITILNEARPGLLSTSGTEADLCATLRAAGQTFYTRREVVGEWLTMHGTPMMVDVKGSMKEIADALRANGKEVQLWADVKAEWLSNNGQRIVLEPEQWDQLHSMRAAVMAHPMGARLMAMRGQAERSVYWIDKETGMLCRCRPDWWTGDFIVDLKSTDDASPEGFRKSIANYAYDVQDAFYHDGMAAVEMPIRGFFFLAVEKTARVVEGKSFGVAVYQLDEDSRALGRAKYRADLAKYAECVESGDWPNYGDRIQPISLPQWNFSANQHLVTA